MTDIMLVDDEVLALEYLKNMVDWEKNGYHVVCLSWQAAVSQIVRHRQRIMTTVHRCHIQLII